jgi:hypothetical protein
MTRHFIGTSTVTALNVALFASAVFAPPTEAADLFSYVGGEAGVVLHKGKIVPDNVPFVYGAVTGIYWPEISLSYCGADGYRSLFVTSANDIFVGGEKLRTHFGTVISYRYFWPEQPVTEGEAYGQTGAGGYESEVVFGGGVGFFYELDSVGSFVDPRFICRYHSYRGGTVSHGRDSESDFNFVIAERSVFLLAGWFGIKTKVEISLDVKTVEMTGWRAYAGPCLLF